MATAGQNPRVVRLVQVREAFGNRAGSAEEVEDVGIPRELPGELGLVRLEAVGEKGGSSERVAPRCLRPALTSVNDRAA